MITCRCRAEGCGATAEFLTTVQAEEAGWWVNLNPGSDPSDLCPDHNEEGEQ